jgi:uncharacterized protein YecT (DUF1311 family)
VFRDFVSLNPKERNFYVIAIAIHIRSNSRKRFAKSVAATSFQPSISRITISKALWSNTQRRLVTGKNHWIFLLLIGASAHAASFNCAKAKTPQEKAICASPEASAVDDQMAAAYKAALAATSPEVQAEIRHDQLDWIRNMTAECGAGDAKLADCLIIYEGDRTTWLQRIAQSPAVLLLRIAPLPVTMKNELAAVVIAEIADGDQSHLVDQKRIAFDSQVSFLRLRAGALPAILIEPSDEAQMCDQWNFNCPFWLFQQSNGHAVLLLNDTSESISMAKTTHNGMRDLEIDYRDGHTPVDMVFTVLQFDGKAYHPAICSESIAGGDENDTEVEVPPHPCNTPGQRIVKH